MTNAGWYPDPAGAPDTYRYWDGQAWSQMTTTTPPVGNAPQAPQQPQQPAQPPQQPPAQPQTVYGAVPPVAQPPAGGYGQSPGSYGQPQPGGYGQQPWSPTPQQGGSGGGKGKVVGIVIAAVLALVLIGVGGFFGIRALTGDDDKDTKADDDTSQSSDESGSTDSTDETGEPTDGTSSTVRPTGIQCTGGSPEPAKPPATSATSLTGGGLTIPVLSGYTVEPRSAAAHSFADSVQVEYKEVIPDKWISEYAVGGLAKANDFTSPEQAAEIVMQCLTASDQFYEGFTGRKDLKREEVTVDGKTGYRITAELRVSDPEVTYGGDQTTVIVVDTGDADSYGMFLGVVPLGESSYEAQLESTISGIEVG
ncbi:hypothetical protein CFH99_01975 [Nocardioides aromaticivorans]|uniref:DUF2510 domain-containing protein n=1 Tax=Nocardioides aromaticivorans TaxID=200618 RepID=A0ABX7PF25_9ACTN|nr:DUF2510 domain-containing protein [Nocardioides aromaticivorans]QSR24390.1 hypothetical protein CFH99_01975 [Nocardioides aromaticivorans]